MKDVVAISLQNLTEGTKNPLSEYKTAFHCLQIQRHMTPVTDSPTPGPADLPPFEMRVVAENAVGGQAEIGSSNESILETLSISSELDVAFEMDLVEIPDEEPWDDNDSDSDAGVDSETSEDEL